MRDRQSGLHDGMMPGKNLCGHVFTFEGLNVSSANPTPTRLLRSLLLIAYSQCNHILQMLHDYNFHLFSGC